MRRISECSADKYHSEEEDPDEYPFPLTLRSKKPSTGGSPNDGYILNGGS